MAAVYEAGTCMSLGQVLCFLSLLRLHLCCQAMLPYFTARCDAAAECLERDKTPGKRRAPRWGASRGVVVSCQGMSTMPTGATSAPSAWNALRACCRATWRRGSCFLLSLRGGGLSLCSECFLCCCCCVSGGGCGDLGQLPVRCGSKSHGAPEGFFVLPLLLSLSSSLFFSLSGQGGGSPRCPCRILATTAGPSGVGQGTRQGLLLLAPLATFAPRCQKGRRSLCRHAYFRLSCVSFFFRWVLAGNDVLWGDAAGTAACMQRMIQACVSLFH